METQAPNQTAPKAAVQSILRHLLTAERVVMALVLLGVGLSGCLSLVFGSIAGPTNPVLGANLMKAGFAYPLLKGTEILLELWIGASTTREAR